MSSPYTFPFTKCLYNNLSELHWVLSNDYTIIVWIVYRINAAATIRQHCIVITRIHPCSFSTCNQKLLSRYRILYFVLENMYLVSDFDSTSDDSLSDFLYYLYISCAVRHFVSLHHNNSYFSGMIIGVATTGEIRLSKQRDW